jgi:HAD superfamily hydrolase (TIGR01458 family)
MPRFQAALIDLSGTLHIGDQAIQGAVEACEALQRAGIKVKYLTNTTKVSSSTLFRQLRSIGFDGASVPSQDSIMTSATATRDHLKINSMRPLCFVEEELLADLEGISLEDPNCVLVGLAPSMFHYDKLNQAFRLLINSKMEKNESISPLIAMHRGLYYKDSDNELSLGPGGFVSLLEETAGVKAHVVGKPSKHFFQAAVASLDVDAKETVMIGDDVTSDIAGARAAGMAGAILVQTGKYRAGDENKHHSKVERPTFVAESIIQAVEYILADSSDC